MDDREVRIYKFVGRPEHLDKLEQLLLHIEYFGNVGASRNLLVLVDGDGAARIRVMDKDDLFVSDYVKLKNENPTEQETIKTTISGQYSFE